MAPTTRNASAAERSSQPRRKTSASLQQRRESSMDLDEQDAARPSIEEDAMEVDTSSFLRSEAVQKETAPLRELAERVGREVEQFAELVDQWKTTGQSEDQDDRQNDILRLVGNYQDVAQDTIRVLRQRHSQDEKRVLEDNFSHKPEDKRFQPRQTRGHTTDCADLLRWQEEANTWSLVYEMLQAEFEGPDPKELVNENDRFSADGQSWEDFIISSKTAQERLIVLRWLETTAEKTGGIRSDLEVIESTLDNRAKRSTFDGWLDTKERIKSEKRLRLWDVPIDSTAAQAPKIRNAAGDANLVTQLDLDAPKRQDLTLEKDDLQFEHSFWTMIWEMLRRGWSMTDIREWCADRGQQARALSIGAYGDTVRLNASRRFLWRQACLRLARSGGSTEHERAVYGLISGDDRAAELVSSGWNDSLYILCNHEIVQQYESWLSVNHQQEFPREGTDFFRIPAQSNIGEASFGDIRHIIKSLQCKERSRFAERDFQREMQAALIGHDLVEFIFQQGVAISKDAIANKTPESFWDVISTTAEAHYPDDGHAKLVSDDADATRTLAHLYLILQDIGYDFGEGPRLAACENVLTAYLNVLHQAGKFTLMPTYASRLSQERQKEVLARSCRQIRDEQEKQEFVNMMTHGGIDAVEVVYRFVLLTLENSGYKTRIKENHTVGSRIELMRPEADHKWPYQRVKIFDELGRNLTAKEKAIIESVGWFKLVEGAWARTFSSLTEIAFAFLKAGRFQAAMRLIEVMPSEELSLMKSAEHLDRPISVMDDHEDGEDEARPDLRRSSRLERQSSPRANGSRRTRMPNQQAVHRDLLKAHVWTYHDLEQLIIALQCIITCGSLEYKLIELRSSKNAEDVHKVPNIKKAHRDTMNDLVQSMEPLLHEFLQSPPPYVPAAALQAMRIQYLPEMIIAYAACLHCAGYIQSREHLLQCLDLATNVADNDDLIQTFKEATAPRYRRRGAIIGEWDDGKAFALLEQEASQANGTSKLAETKLQTIAATHKGPEAGDDGNGKGRMKELVDGMASASQAILNLNEMNQGKTSKKRGKNGRTLAIWDVPAKE